MSARLRCAAAPCRSCPYRRDVPSGVWAADEYDKLPAYDGDMLSQLEAGGTGLFMCHQLDGQLCAGWIGCHGAAKLIAFRFTRVVVPDSVWRYQSPVPLFASGAAAASHGKRALRRPGKAARQTMARLLAKRERG